MTTRVPPADVFHDIVLSFSSQRALDPVLEQTVEGVRRLLRARAAAVALFDDCGGLRHAVSDGIPEEALAAGADGDLPPGMLAFPLARSGRRFGMICAAEPEQGSFGLEDARLLERLSAYAAIAIENAEIFEQQEAELERAARSAVRERRRLEEVVRGLPVGIAILDRRLCYQFCNDAYAAFHGLAACDLVDRSAWDVHPVATKALAHHVDAVLAGERRVLSEVPYHLPEEADDAPFRYADLHLLPLPGEAGATEGLVIIAWDATSSVEARRRVEELAALAGSRAAEFEAVLENIADPILVVDERGATKLANAAMERLARDAGVPTLKGAIRSLAARLRQPDGRPVRPESSPLARALRGERVRSEESILTLPDGARLWLIFDASPFYGPSGAILGAVSIIRDVSALKNHERLRDEFIDLVAHQLRTPLTVIYGVARKLVRESAEVPGDVRDQLMRDMYEESDRLRELIEDLLLLGQAQTRMEYKAEPMRPEQALTAAVDECRRFALSQELRLTLEPDLPIVLADPSLLTQIMRTLITNASRYSQPDSEIEVGVSGEARAVRVSVLDRGIGLGDEDPELLFEPFYRAPKALHQQGSGLGLAIARRLVELQGGTMWAERREGGGAVFSFTLPAAEPLGD